MRKLALAALAIGAISLSSVVPAEARWVHRSWGSGIGLAGALAFGTPTAAAAYYYGPNYYYGPAYYPAYHPAPYGGPVYYGRPYYYLGPYW